MLISKAKATVNADLYVFNCRSKKLESALLVISFNAMGVDAAQVCRSIGGLLEEKLACVRISLFLVRVFDTIGH